MSFGVNVADESDDDDNDDEDDSEKQQTTTLAPQILWLPETLHSTHIHPHTHTHTLTAFLLICATIAKRDQTMCLGNLARTALGHVE